MPYPKKGEKQSSYVSRFVSSGEARDSFPDKKQRLAVAYSIYRQKHTAKRVRERK
jgi:hypothetical protein